jgi:four helix bundle protein
VSRDPQKLEAFQLADSLVVDLYRVTSRFPLAERFGLQAQLRRAAVSVTANLVEGSARRSERDYLYFVMVAIGFASEVRYLVKLSAWLGFVPSSPAGSEARGPRSLVSRIAPSSHVVAGARGATRIGRRNAAPTTST